MFFLVPAYPGSPGQKAVKWLCVCVCCDDRFFESADHQHGTPAAAADVDVDDDDDGQKTFVALILDSLLHHDCECRVLLSV